MALERMALRVFMTLLPPVPKWSKRIWYSRYSSS